MAHTPAWRNFKRMQDMTAAAACLIYAAAAVHAISVLPGEPGGIRRWVLVWPLAWFLACLVIPLMVGPLRRGLARYVWASFLAGFGQTAVSVVSGVALLLGAGLFINWQVARAVATGQLAANVFSAYAAGIGILAVQAILTRALERRDDVKPRIEA
jgi:hypothetical protein